MARRKIKLESPRPHCEFARGQQVRVDTHESQRGAINYSGWLGVVSFSTAIFKEKQVDFEQVTVELRNGPAVILKTMGRSGVDKVRHYSYCDKCGETKRNCFCNGSCSNCERSTASCRCCTYCNRLRCIC